MNSMEHRTTMYTRASGEQRVYAPTRGSMAYAYEAQVAQPMEREIQSTRQSRRTKVRPRKKSINAAGKFALLCSVLFLSVSAVLVVAGYANITQEYSTVNDLKDEIEQSELRLAELNAQLACAVTLDDALEAAQRMGMNYPTADQYVAVGEKLPEQTSASE